LGNHWDHLGGLNSENKTNVAGKNPKEHIEKEKLLQLGLTPKTKRNRDDKPLEV
jgi:hypothetical protein